MCTADLEMHTAKLANVFFETDIHRSLGDDRTTYGRR